MRAKCLSLYSILSIAPLLLMAPDLVGARCAGVALKEIRSLRGLPTELRRLLPKQTQGLDGIADSGERFNITDVVDHDLPMRRFTLAAVGDNCAVMAVEHGGYAHYFELIEYRLTGSAWRSLDSENVERKPTSIDDLLNLHGWPK